MLKSALTNINHLLPKEFQRDSQTPEELAQTLNHCVRHGLLDRRTFLQIAGLITTTSGLAQLLFPTSAHGMYNLGAFWKKSTVSSSSYPINSGGDPYWDYVSLLMNMNMPTPSTGFTTVFPDESNVGKNMTITGTPLLDVGVTPYSGGKGSAKFNGSADYLSLSNTTAFRLGTTLTIECWFNLTSTPGSFIGVCGLWNAGGSRRSYAFGVSSGKLSFPYTADGSTVVHINGTTTLSTGTWYHAAVVVSGGSATLYLNGTADGSGTVSSIYNNTTDNLTIGALEAGSGFFPGSIVDLRIYKGAAKYTSSFSRPTSPLNVSTTYDKYWGYCSLACPFETSLKDVSGRYPTLTGSPTLSTAQKKFGTSSLLTDQSAVNGISFATGSATNFGTGDFTLEGWIYPTSTGTGDFATLMSHSDYYGSANGNWVFRMIPTGVSFNAYDAQSNQEEFIGTILPTFNAWNHVAAVRTGTRLTIYVNSVACGSGTLNKAIGDDINGVNVGVPTTGAYRLSYIDSVRITKGYARYRGNFTPPTAAFPVGKDESSDPFWTYTVLAMGMDDFTEQTGRNSVASNTSVTTSTSVKRYGSGSASFNGSSSVITFNSSSDLDFSTADFTVEFWAYPTSTTSGLALSNVRNQAVNSDRGPLNIYVAGNTEVAVRSGDDSTWFMMTSVNSGAKTPTNAWSHIAMTRRGSNLYLFTNGILTLTYTYTSPLSGALPLALGRQYSSSVGTTAFYSGYLDDLRITKGVARYIQNFNPPTRVNATAQYPSGSGSIVTSGLVCHLDAGDSGSYDGSSQTWNNLVATPADGSAKAAYNFNLGSTSSSESTDATFVGVSGGKTANDYFFSDGGDYFLLTGSNTTFLDSLHKAGATFTIETVFYRASLSDSFYLCADENYGTSGIGIGLQITSAGKLSFYVYSGTSYVKQILSDTSVTTGYYHVAISLNESGGSTGGFMTINGSYAPVSSANQWNPAYSSPPTSGASKALSLFGARGSAATYAPAGTRAVIYRMYNRALTKTELDQSWNATRTRFGL